MLEPHLARMVACQTHETLDDMYQAASKIESRMSNRILPDTRTVNPAFSEERNFIRNIQFQPRETLRPNWHPPAYANSNEGQFVWVPYRTQSNRLHQPPPNYYPSNDALRFNLYQNQYCQNSQQSDPSPRVPDKPQVDPYQRIYHLNYQPLDTPLQDPYL